MQHRGGSIATGRRGHPLCALYSLVRPIARTGIAPMASTAFAVPGALLDHHLVHESY
jgi:hypothetical protein